MVKASVDPSKAPYYKKTLPWSMRTPKNKRLYSRNCLEPSWPIDNNWLSTGKRTRTRWKKVNSAKVIVTSILSSWISAVLNKPKKRLTKKRERRRKLRLLNNLLLRNLLSPWKRKKWISTPIWSWQPVPISLSLSKPIMLLNSRMTGRGRTTILPCLWSALAPRRRASSTASPRSTSPDTHHSTMKSIKTKIRPNRTWSCLCRNRQTTRSNPQHNHPTKPLFSNNNSHQLNWKTLG